MFVHTKFLTFFALLITFSQTHVSLPSSDLIRHDDNSINGFITSVIQVCKGNGDQYSCQNLLLELTTLPSSLSEMRRRDLLIVVLKNSMWKVENAMIGVRKDLNLLEEMESDMLGVREDMNLLEEMMESAKDGLISSMDELLGGGNPNLRSYANVHTWLSGVLTSYLTCIDGISEGAYKRRVESELEDLVSRSRVALAILISISPKDTKLQSVDPSGPSWLSDIDKNFLDLTPEALKKIADVVVAKDGSGNYNTVNAAIAAAPQYSKKRFVIYIKKGIYEEIVIVTKPYITLIGDGEDSTILTGNLNYKDGTKTFDTATLASNGEGFIARDMCFRNTAGPAKGPAVALRVSGDMSVLYRCRIEGYQDALYAHQKRQFYRDCYIAGTIDFICGDASAVFQFCRIVARKPLKGQANMITAQSREDLTHTSGFSLQKCNITASSDLAPVTAIVKTYLGRPWRNYSTVAVIHSFLDDLIDPSGWAPWQGEFAPSTILYREYQNIGPGADTKKRVNWTGFRVISDPKEAANFTVAKLLEDENVWLNATGVPYEEGL